MNDSPLGSSVVVTVHARGADSKAARTSSQEHIAAARYDVESYGAAASDVELPTLAPCRTRS